MITLATAGHRHPTLLGPTVEWIGDQIGRTLDHFSPDVVSTGLHARTDLWISEAALVRAIPLVVHLVHPLQHREWRGPNYRRHQDVIAKAEQVLIHHLDGPRSAVEANRMADVRNGRMLGDADRLYLVWNGRLGNTSALLRLALQTRLPVTITDPSRRKTVTLSPTTRARLAERLGVPVLEPDPATTAAA